MPFKSKAQQGYLHAHPEILGKAGLAEWDRASKGKHLPMKKKTPKHTHIEHHTDGSKTIRHQHHDGSETSHAVADHGEMMDHLEHHLGTPNEGEETPQASATPPAAVPPMAQ
jgi:hypothetical protein